MTEHDYLDGLIEPLLWRLEKAVREVEEVTRNLAEQNRRLDVHKAEAAKETTRHRERAA